MAGQHQQRHENRNRLAITSMLNDTIPRPPKVLALLAGNVPSRRPTQVFPRGSSDFLVSNQIMSFDELMLKIQAHPGFASVISAAFMACPGSDILVDRESEESGTSHGVEISCRDRSSNAFNRKSSLNAPFLALKSAMKLLHQSSSPLVQEMVSTCGSVVLSTPEPRGPLRVRPGARARLKLDAWFNEHFENPYPKLAEKKKLAESCGINLSQVDNYFGNRRRRVKQMILKTSFRENTMPLLSPLQTWQSIVLSCNKNQEIDIQSILPRSRGFEASTHLPAEVPTKRFPALNFGVACDQTRSNDYLSSPSSGNIVLRLNHKQIDDDQC